MKTRNLALTLALALLLAVSVILPAAAREPDEPRGGLPLGKPGLSETRGTEKLAPGVEYTRIERGETSEKDVYTVDVSFESDRKAAEELARELRRDGYKPRVETISERAPDDPESGPLGHLVRTGSFDEEAGAVALADRLEADGYSEPSVVYTGEDGGRTSGPWVVHALEVDPDRYGGELAPELATEVVPGRERLTSISEREDSLAAVNGGYFVIEEEDGTPGDLAGASVLDGELVSETVEGRTNLILPEGSGGDAEVASISDSISVESPDGVRREVDGKNRKPGLIRNCGGEGGDEPTEEPKHDFTCTDESELIRFTPVFGPTTEPGEGAEAVLDASGHVVELREGRGGPIPEGGSVLSGTGEGADWLRDHARPGCGLRIEEDILAGGDPLPERTGVVNGGPRLLEDGEAEIAATAEGFHRQEEPEFYYRFGERRNPRTLAGVTAEGHLLLVAVDGRRPGYSVGASFEESAAIMQSLGAEEAVNLDGGGSTSITLDDDLVNRPSDPGGERPVGDAVLLEKTR